MRIFKAGLKVAAVLVFAVLINTGMTFLLEPYGSKSEVMWTDYRQEEEIDLVFAGTSLAERAFDPAVIEAETGLTAYNMATPGQWIEESYLAIQTAVEDHQPGMVVFGFEYCDLQGEKFPDPGRAFLRNKAKGDLGERLGDIAYCLSNERCYAEKSSINWMFPWISNNVKPSPAAILRNVEMKLDGTTVYEAAESNEPGWIYYGNGYGNYDICFDYNEGKSTVYADTYGHRNFDEQKMATLAAMGDYCAAHDVEFLVVAPPIPAFNVFEYGKKYFTQHEQIRELVEAHGGEYYDLNLARPELFDVTEESYFADYQHLNVDGGVAATAALLRLLETRATGGDVESLFYTQEEYGQAMSFVDFVLLDVAVVEGGILMTAEALAGPEVEVEYQMCVKDEATGAWTAIREWSSEPTCLYAESESGTYQLRVNAREVGSDVEYDRYRIATVTK